MRCNIFIETNIALEVIFPKKVLFSTVKGNCPSALNMYGSTLKEHDKLRCCYLEPEESYTYYFSSCPKISSSALPNILPTLFARELGVLSP